MKIITSLFLFLGLTFHLFAQTEKLNQFDSDGKKDGKWTVYLDANWNKVDSSKAAYFRYTWFDHGVNLHPMGTGGGKKYKMESSPNRSSQTGKVKILDGEYKWYNGKGQLKYVHVFKNGEYILYKEFYSTGELQTFFDYTKICEGQPHSWTAFLYDKKGNLTITSPTCKDKNGNWPKMRG